MNYARVTPPTEKLTCYHCGDDCPDDLIHIEEKHFCCHGCKTVFEILSENDLCTYYDLEQSPGTKQKKPEFGDKFAFLDNPEIARKLLNYADENLEKVTLHVPNMHCSSCIWLLENLYKLREGVNQSRVNFVKRQLTLTYNPQKISLRQVAELLTTLGYEPTINLDNLNQQEKQSENKQLLYKIGVTGFCFGNIMLLSFPDYLAVEDWVNNDYKYFFGFLNILLALPVFFYSSREYFVSAYKSLRVGVVNLDVPIALGIIALFGRSLYEILTVTGAGYLDSMAGLLFFLLVGKWVQNKTYQNFAFDRDYTSYFPLAVRVKKGEGIETRVITDLKKGEEMLIRNQELIPADSILIADEAYIDYSFVTGEATPVSKKKGEYLYAGGRQVGNSISLIVQKEVEQSYLTQLWNSEAFAKEAPQKMSKRIAIFSKYFTYGTLAVAFSTLAFWYFFDANLMWNTFTAVLIVACPCALALATPYALGNTMRIFGLHKFYLKNSDVIEQLSEIQHLVFDKTGTITQNQESDIQFIPFEDENPLTEGEQQAIKTLAAHSTHPLSQKLYQFLQNVSEQELSNFEEIAGKGIQGQVKGFNIQLGSAVFVGAENFLKSTLQTTVFIKFNGKVRGYFVIQNQYRTALKPILADLQNQYDTSLVTGDNEGEKENLQNYFHSESQLYFNQKPADKLQFIQNLQTQNQKVLMLGDGLNDAGALQQSNVGIALSEDTSSFSPACDAILDAQAFEKLPQFLKFSKVALKVVKASFVLSVLYNLVGLSFAVTGNLAPVLAAILMPLSSVTVVAFVVTMTNIFSQKYLKKD